MLMKGKIQICLTGLLLGTNHGCITTNPNQSVPQCNGNISFIFDQKVQSLRFCHQLGRLCLPCFGILLAHFQKHGENVNSASNCEVLFKLPNKINRKHPGQLARRALLHHDNARPHTARAPQDRIQELQWKLLEHLPYSPDLAPNDFHLFGPLKNHLGSRCFNDDEEVET
jgi:hypothetical protein